MIRCNEYTERIKKVVFHFLLLLALQNYVQAQDSTCILWYPPVQLTDSTYSAYTPEIALTGDDSIHVSWWEGEGLQHRLPYIRSVNGGENWEVVLDLAIDSMLFPEPFARRRITTGAQSVYIFSAGEFDPPSEIAMSKSTDGGTTWTTTRVGPDSAAGIYSATSMGDTLTVVYSPYYNGFVREPMLIYSTDGGVVWQQLLDTLDGWTQTAYTPGVLHLTRRYVNSGDIELLYKQSYDVGNTFPDSMILSTVDGLGSYESDIASVINDTGSVLFLVWRDAVECAAFIGCTIIGRESHDGGLTWSDPMTLTDLPDGMVPAVALNKEGMVAASWGRDATIDQTIHVVVRFRKTPNSPWTQIMDVTPNTDYAGNSSIAVSSKAIHVVWEELVGGSLGTYRIFYRKGIILNQSSTIPYEKGWNLVSLPFQTDSVYDLPSMYSFDGEYHEADTMKFGVGYWAKLDGMPIAYSGEEITADTIDVKAGWNIIGSLSCPIHIGSVISNPPGIIGSPWFEYNNLHYNTVEILEPGRGYWVKVKKNGQMILRGN